MTTPSSSDLARTLAAYGFRPGELVELAAKPERGMRARTFRVEDAEAAAAWLAAQEASGARDFYLVANPLRASPAGARAGDEDVAEVRLLLIDCDPRKTPDDPQGTSGAARADCALLAGRITKLLKVELSVLPLRVDSGRGQQLLLRHDPELPQAERAALLEALHRTHAEPRASVDLGMHNPSRLVRLPGATNSRTGRTACVFNSGVGVASVAAVEALLARLAPPPAPAAAPTPTPTPRPRRPHVAADPADELAVLRSALSAIDPDPRDNWVRVGAALHADRPADGKALWDAWSAGSAKFDGPDGPGQSATWRSFDAAGNARGRVGLGTVFHLARETGWEDPRHRDPARAPTRWAPPPRADAPHAPATTAWCRRHGSADHALALAVLCQTRALLGRAAYVEAVRVAWHAEDPGATWDGAAANLARHVRLPGAGELRRELGAAALQALAEALARDLGLDQAEAVRRLGLPRGARGLDLPALLEHVESEAVRRRLPRAERCGAYGEHRHCGFCGDHLSHRRLRCGVLELCWRCAAAYHRGLLGWLGEHWAGCRYVVAEASYHTRDDAAAAVVAARRASPEHAVYLLSCAQTAGVVTWTALAVAEAGTPAAAGVEALGTHAAALSRERALERVGRAALARTATVLDLLGGGHYQAAAETIEELYHTPVIRRSKAMALPWPTREQVRTWLPADARAQRAASPDETCAEGHLIEVVGVRRVYVVEATGEVVGESDRWPLSLAAVARLHDFAAAQALAEPWSAAYAQDLAVPR